MSIDMVLSNSRSKSWRRCPKQYEYKYVEKLKPKQKKIQLERGSWIHDLLMYHYDSQVLGGYDPTAWRRRHAELSEQFYTLFEEEREELGDLPVECERIVSGYMMHYAKEDKQWKVIDSELDETIELPNGLKFRMIVDLVIEDQFGLWIVDHKTVKNFMDPDYMLLDSQLARYHWGMTKLGYPIIGTMFNELITNPPTPPDVLQSGRLTTKQSMRCDAYTYLRKIHELGQDPKSYREVLLRLRAQSDRWYRRTRMPKERVVTHTMMHELDMTARQIIQGERRGEFPRTPDKSCAWMCDFTDLCIVQLQGGDGAELIKRRYERRNRKDD